ncbi:LVIVD repeat-containing protein [Solirubrobacter pauli]|uniref:LVIVD repeat-containing protein n=1 Tax=Solirubrobacter pauli TaxID=166793 RepID=A0A660LDG8_9ACTN|nr:hypothetical protein [Solirubrobacter pauli]RKQ90761.1 LVIVD repeat-containing protein [Solirubrobacter pauli]
MSHHATHRRARRVFGAALGAAVLFGATAVSASAQQFPVTSGDPRIGLAPGVDDATAGKAALGLQHLANRPKPAAVAGTNSDLAFQGDYAFNGNYDGVNIYNIADPADPKLVTSIFCPGSQNDVSVWNNLLFVSVESTSARKDCARGTGTAAPADAFRGIRIFDISDIQNPKQVAGVQTCRGSHTHTLVRPKNDAANLYIYVSGTAAARASTELAGCYKSSNPGLEPDDAAASGKSSRWRIDVIKVPVADPASAAVVSGPRLFADEATGKHDGLQQTLPTPQHPSGTNWSPQPISDACHDITVYEEINLAAGACEGNGLLIDISDPANPKRIDAVADPLFAYWHGATFSNDGKAVLFTDEWGGGSGARCRATDQMSWGADAIYEIVNNKLVFRSYYKLPVAQTVNENCVSHVGNLIPVPGRNIMVQAWYQGGASIIDWTDLSKPKEIGYFDRGPLNTTQLPSSAGYWSTYWYNGRIYGSEIARGFDSLKLTPTANLTAGEIAAAERLPKQARLNAQSQDKVTTWASAPVEAPVGGTVPATLSLSLGAAQPLGPFTPGVAKLYEATTKATVTSTAGDATLSVADPSSTATGHLVNGTFSLPQPLQVRARNAANTGTAYNNLGSGLNLLTYSGPVSNDQVDVQFGQQINANDALRTGSYSKTLTFTLSTTNP